MSFSHSPIFQSNSRVNISQPWLRGVNEQLVCARFDLVVDEDENEHDSCAKSQNNSLKLFKAAVRVILSNAKLDKFP